MKIWRKNFPDTVEHYLRTWGRHPFTARPFNDVDSLLLCQLAYLQFDGLVPAVNDKKGSVRLGELWAERYGERLFQDVLFAEENRILFAEMASSRRFCRLGLNCYINLIDTAREVQFAAVTYLLEDGTVYIAFRGTDATLVGWKEDFNMTFCYPVPGQALAAKYLNMVAERFSNPFYVGGHSKGGNFAVYGAMYCATDIRRRILKIYNMDGPGFRPEVLQSGRYMAIADRVVKYMPHSSVIGMMLAADDHYHVVEAHSFGVLQHNPFRWKVRDGSFVPARDIRGRIRMADNAVNEWIWSLDQRRLGRFINTLYRVLQAAQADDLISLAADWRHSVSRIYDAARGLDQETGQFLRDTADSLFELMRTRRRGVHGNRRRLPSAGSISGRDKAASQVE